MAVVITADNAAMARTHTDDMCACVDARAMSPSRAHVYISPSANQARVRARRWRRWRSLARSLARSVAVAMAVAIAADDAGVMCARADDM